MTATKVEFQELSSEGPTVEEIGSYSYTAQEENGPQKSQNGVFIEEFSETSDNDRLKLQVNRGVSIVSVSDDESTLKGISRDVSMDDVQCAELTDDLRLVNGSSEEFKNFDGRTIEKIVLDEARPLRATKLNETIIEERSIEESITEKAVESNLNDQPQKGVVQDSELTTQSSTIETAAPLKSPEKVEEVSLEKSQKPLVQNGTLSRQSSKIERLNSVPEQVVEQTLPKSEQAIKEDGKLSRQSSRLERVDSVESYKAERKTISRENSQKGVLADREEVDEELEALLDRVKRQRSVLNEILDKEQGVESGMIETLGDLST
ncbi:hypothetical protein KPH14_005735 [Odynerus spinipes]|uniref:Uncharacterized protein n=1 Tax=Odynerus spinipes TaxID=1348599 RepID=A0AAD9RB03_9HYME|nr:hypothetical protein KPH14_005735 [Odynerus spinipes]